MSNMGWVAIDDSENQQVQKILKLFLETDARDELGLGVIRDSISDIMFPGTSVLQTRLRYMLFVPLIHRILVKDINKQGAINKGESAESQIYEKIVDLELELVQSLKKGKNKTKIIGVNAGRNLQTFPNQIYWSGLKSWGICTSNGSSNHFLTSIVEQCTNIFKPNFEDDNTSN